ncbi:exported protein of unknown function (plasmid) [Cupriavidus taiwanensis]|uniref:ABC transporter, periplasmic solute-binding protein n=1 Tax=Cupriavidus taiwanensis TaxID=164546 RepID=A0A375IJU0_9BURK|nr:exported protein of unknown function [Cupriavidus taiwanensis]
MQPSFTTTLRTTAALLALTASGTALAQKTTLIVYTAWETETLKPYAEGFAKAAPDIELKYVRDSTGVITAKALAEKANPQADVIAGLAASSLELLKQEGMLAPYTPKGFEKLTRDYSGKATPPSWVGLDVWGATICFNTIEAKKRNLPRPETWKDLAKPVYKGTIVMPNPASSGTGFLDVTAWLQLYGEQEGWKYMDALHENIAQYTHSGSKPCKQAGSGEFPIGISFELRAHKTLAAGAPIEMIFPKKAWATTSRPPASSRARRRWRPRNATWTGWPARKPTSCSPRTGPSWPTPAWRERSRPSRPTTSRCWSRTISAISPKTASGC